MCVCVCVCMCVCRLEDGDLLRATSPVLSAIRRVGGKI